MTSSKTIPVAGYDTVEVSEDQRLPADVELHVRLDPSGPERLEVVASAGE